MFTMLSLWCNQQDMGSIPAKKHFSIIVKWKKLISCHGGQVKARVPIHYKIGCIGIYTLTKESCQLRIRFRCDNICASYRPTQHTLKLYVSINNIIFVNNNSVHQYTYINKSNLSGIVLLQSFFLRTYLHYPTVQQRKPFRLLN